MTDYATLTTKCPHCENPIEIENVWEPGGMSDSGGLMLECGKCAMPFEVHVGRDINMSRPRKGARVLGRYDDDVEGSRARVLTRHGLSPSDDKSN